jgi:hypothetical protein
VSFSRLVEYKRNLGERFGPGCLKAVNFGLCFEDVADSSKESLLEGSRFITRVYFIEVKGG